MPYSNIVVHVLKLFNFHFHPISPGLDPLPIPPGYTKLLNGGWSCATGYTGVVDGCCQFNDICMPRWLGKLWKNGRFIATKTGKRHGQMRENELFMVFSVT